MTDTRFDVCGIGNAIVDILAYTDDAFLVKQGLPKGSMTLIDESKAKELYSLMGTATECSGGSAANTIAGIASLGGKAAFIGKVAADQMGDIFKHDMKTIKVHFENEPLKKSVATASCLVFVTGEEKAVGKDVKRKKVERTMATFLGASRHISEKDIKEDVIRDSKVTYLEGYLWDEQAAKEAITKAIQIAHKHGRKVAFSLSDGFCVERHRDEFMELIKNHVDIVFANHTEAKSLFQEDDLRKIYSKCPGLAEIFIITKSEDGSVIITSDEIHHVDAVKVKDLYDVTGAGDLYAAGFLHAYVNGHPLDKCGRLGSICATEVIKYLGARPLTKLTDVLKDF